ncbi:MAG TPA: PAS domain-containing protein [bacterium]|nr:PAS domain-containing protein [bacterium]
MNSVNFKTGNLTQREIEAILNVLPGDLTFVGPDDKIRYFNEPKQRLFSRSPSILGGSVQGCHPEKSVPAVNTVIADLKAGRADVVESRAKVSGRPVSIKYLAVRDEAGAYLGCLEIAQEAGIS